MKYFPTFNNISPPWWNLNFALCSSLCLEKVSGKTMYSQWGIKYSVVRILFFLTEEAARASNGRVRNGMCPVPKFKCTCPECVRIAQCCMNNHRWTLGVLLKRRKVQFAVIARFIDDKHATWFQVSLSLRSASFKSSGLHAERGFSCSHIGFHRVPWRLQGFSWTHMTNMSL